jgi:hypothetical protein
MRMKTRRRIYPTRGGRRPGGRITLFRQDIPAAKFTALAVHDRYCLLLMGHIHDELSWLQRITYIASRSEPGTSREENSANLMQVLLVSRLFLGKLHEFYVVFRDVPALRLFVEAHYSTTPGAGTQKVGEIEAAFNSHAWLRTARNQSFLHYPTLGQATTTLEDPKVVWDLEVLHGRNTANTMYPTADVFANMHWFKIANPQDAMGGLAGALDAAKGLAALVMQTLEQTIGNFVHQNLQDLSNHEVVRLPVRDSIHDVRINYFMNVEPRRK